MEQPDILFSGTDSWTHFDHYHALAAEVQQGIAGILDEVLQRHGVSSIELRKKAVASFLFDFSAALDSKGKVELSGGKDVWIPTLAFLKVRQLPDSSPSREIEAAMITLNTALHDIAMDQSDAYFEMLERKQEES
jgi:hypothetical protein